jgi:hypothetical protein
MTWGNDEMIRSGAASWHNNYLISATPYQSPQKKWMNKIIKPKNWNLRFKVMRIAESVLQ